MAQLILAGYQPVVRALRIFVTDPRLVAYLAEHDPKALQQAREALRLAGVPAMPEPADVHYVAYGRIACGQTMTCTATIISALVSCPECLDKIAELSPGSDRDATREDLDRPFDYDRDGVE